MFFVISYNKKANVKNVVQLEISLRFIVCRWREKLFIFARKIGPIRGDFKGFLDHNNLILFNQIFLIH